jgi:hypothetical protein
MNEEDYYGSTTLNNNIICPSCNNPFIQYHEEIWDMSLSTWYKCSCGNEIYYNNWHPWFNLLLKDINILLDINNLKKMIYFNIYKVLDKNLTLLVLADEAGEYLNLVGLKESIDCCFEQSAINIFLPYNMLNDIIRIVYKQNYIKLIEYTDSFKKIAAIS